MIFDKREIKSGNNSTNVVGNGNVIQQFFNRAARLSPPRSYLYDVCLLIINSDIQPSGDFSIEQNAAWMEKLEFNNVSTQYSDILTSDSYAYNDISEIMGTFPKQEVLIRKLHNYYLQAERSREKLDEDGDYVLCEVFKSLNEFLIAHEEQLPSSVAVEEREKAIWLIMFYTFTKCQLLKSPSSK